MRKHDFWVFLGAICAALALAISQFSADVLQTGSWGLSFRQEGQPPVGPASVQELQKHDAVYLGDTSRKVLYLTFDAGYENGNVEKILDVMKEEGVTGAFFILGNLITRNTELVKRMADEGHTVCNHTVRHRDMTRMSNEDFLKELKELETLYEETTGAKMASYYRPPEGRFSRENLMCAEENGYKTIFWSFAYPDWDNNRQMPPEKAKEIILENLHNGEVMLLHPTSETNAAILGDVIRELKVQGYRFGTLDELTAEGT